MMCITFYETIEPIDPLNIDEAGFQITPVTLRNGPRLNGWYVTEGHEKSHHLLTKFNPLHYTFSIIIDSL